MMGLTGFGYQATIDAATAAAITRHPGSICAAAASPAGTDWLIAAKCVRIQVLFYCR